MQVDFQVEKIIINSKGHPILKIECISFDSTTNTAVYEISQYLDGSSHKNTIKINDKV